MALLFAPNGYGSNRAALKNRAAPAALVLFDRHRIVRVETKGGKRIVGDIKRAVTGKISQDQKYVKTTIDKVRGLAQAKPNM
jgi:hypothetical protein